MTDQMRGRWAVGAASGLILALLLLLVFAWVDGGREPLRLIIEPVRPESAR